MQRSPARAFAVFLVVAFASSGVLHNVIPHEHGHDHGARTVWGELHGATRHEQKFALIPVLMLLYAVAVIAVFGVVLKFELVFDDPYRGIALRTARFKHRAFR